MSWNPGDVTTDREYVHLETHPSQYRHLQLNIDGAVATIAINIQEEMGHREGYELKLNSYDISVDIELADVVQRLRFEHPEVSCVVITSATPGVFSSGANIYMLGTSSHAFKVNFCKYTNETRLYIEDATENSGQTYIAACNGITSGGGYELPLACKEIYLVDDRNSAVSLPEIPFLGVLPGTGGLTRVVDKRNVRRDQADLFVTLAEGFKGRKAVKMGLVDAVFPLSRFADSIDKRAQEIAQGGHPDRTGVPLNSVAPTIDEDGLHYRHVEVDFGPTVRTATITMKGPTEVPDIGGDPTALGADWYPLRAWRELDDALLRLRFHYRDVGLVLIKTAGSVDNVLAIDAQLDEHKDHWFVREVRLNLKRVLKRMDVTSKSFFALIEEGSCFAGSLFELALAADRSYMQEDNTEVAVSAMSFGPLPMGNGLTRLQTRFLQQPDTVEELSNGPTRWDGTDAEDAGLVTLVYDDIDWDDEIRIIVEERVSYSPDALTGMEASIRFAGPETLETKIFGRLSAWQNWCFQRTNAVGERGALKMFGQPQNPIFDWERT